MVRLTIALLLLLHSVPVAAGEVVVPTKYAPRPTDIPHALPSNVAVLRQKQAQLAQLQQEIRQLQDELGAQHRIKVRVQMLEVSLTKLEKLRLHLAGLGADYEGEDKSDLEKASKVLEVEGGCSQLPANGDSDSAQHLVNVLTKNNVAKILAEPTVVAMDGQSAAVHAGGHIPYPATPGSKEAVDLRPIGTQVDVLPTSLGDNRVRLELKIGKSDADYSQMQEINGARVPLINVSQCNTGIESEFGQSTVMSGLVETRIETINRGGKVEEVGNRVALVIVVTPELIEATKTAQLPASLK